MTVVSDLADTDALLALAPEELAPIALRTAVEFPSTVGSLHFSWLTYRIYESERHIFENRFPSQRRREVETKLAEAWHLLTAEGILIPEPGVNGQNGYMVLTSRGKALLANEREFRGFTGSTALPKGILHPSIAEPVWKALARGDLETAVFESFRAVEIAVREAGGLAAEDVGVGLMRKAFDPRGGPLTDMGLPDAERESLAHLFAGSIGYYKNPQSHRDTIIASQRRAQEIVLLATHLLYIVEARRLANARAAEEA